MSGARQTPLYEIHVSLGARMVEFGGWSMPIYYASQLEEHHAVREHAGLFDVSHMTVVDAVGADAERYLRGVLANDVRKLRSTPDGQCRALYSCMLRDDGGILDDLIVYRLSDGEFRLVVNAATREKDLAWLLQQVGNHSLELHEQPDLAMIAVQGPQARELVAQTLPHGDGVLALAPFNARRDDGILVARTGYTGEDGFEIILPGSQASGLWAELQALGIAPCGLGARDTLRLEAGLNLYGLDMDETVSPLECGLSWTVDMKTDRDFIGRRAIERLSAAGVETEQAGLILEDKGVLRAGYIVRTSKGEGSVTSGTYSPTLARSVALARVPAGAGDDCEVVIRNRSHAARIVTPPFVRNGKIRIDC